MSASKLFCILCLSILATRVPARGQQVPITSDPYRTWAIQQWGTAVVNDPAQEAAVWGQTADPDRDDHSNLYEYALGTDPKQPSANPVTCDFGKVNAGYLTLNYAQRADDAGLVVFPQYSNDLQTWWPVPPRDAFSWQGDSTYFWTTTTGAVANGMQTVTRVCTESLASAPAAFSRVMVMRNGVAAIGSPLDALTFFDSVSGSGGGTVESNSVVLTGFAGSVVLSVTGGAHLIVNGVDVGNSANVAAGSTVRIRTNSPPTNNSTASYVLIIGNTYTRSWNVATHLAVVPSVNLPPGVSSTPSGYTPVSASVGESGAASVNLPITVSPGTGGMEPKLAIGYSSQGGNGLLGMGFGLSGTSAITRTGPVQYLDNIKGGVAFSANDRFTVDGQRLVLYSGIWGGDGSEYRTEMESFSKVTSQGTTTAGPLSWKVRTKAGLIYEYGTSTDSRILANRSSVSGDTAVLMWALTRITDNVGNSVEFTYATPDGTESGNPRIVSISYTKNTTAGLSPGQQVVFTYETRPDVRTSYVAGAKVVMSKRLTAIECQQSGNVARRYEFAYQQSEISNNSQLISVTEKGKKPTGSGDTWQTFPATTFTWDQKPAANMSLVTDAQATAFDQMSILGNSKTTPSLVVQGDFWGDGHMGVMKFDGDYQSTWIATGKSDGTFTFKSFSGTADSGFTSVDAINRATACLRTGDFNGDGKTDVLHIATDGSNNWLALSKGDGSFNVLRGTQLGALNGVTQTGTYTTQIFALDITGDGLTDLVVLYSSSNSRVLIGNGNGSFREADPGAAFKALRVTDSRPTYEWNLPGDYNGDGLGDILLMYYTGAHTLLLSNGDGTFKIRDTSQLGGLANQSFDLSYAYIESGDFNGDGLTDIAKFNDHSTAWVAYAKGDGTFEAISNPSTLQGLPTSSKGGSVTHLFSGDFNGDGFSDLFNASYYPYNSSSWQSFSQGDTSFLSLLNGQMGVLDGAYYDPPSTNTAASFVFVGDFDGDGTDDVFALKDRGFNVFLARSNGFNANRIVQVTSGHGGYTKFNYKPLTDPTVYTKGTAAVYPNYDIVGAMYVVSSVATRNAVDGDAFTVQTTPAVVESTSTYTYERGLAVLDGHGYQGFSAVQSTNVDTGITSRTEYVTGDPYLAGHPARQVQTLSTGVVISETVNSWTSNPTTLSNGMKTYFPYTTQSVTKAYEINNGVGAAPIKITTVSGQAYDAYGNLTHSLTDYGGGFAEETTSLYNNDTSNWWLGRLYDTVVTQTSPGSVTATRHSTFQYSPTNGQLTRETIVTPESNLRLQKDYIHDKFGNIQQSTLTDLGTGASRTTTTTYTPDGRFINQTTNALNQTESKTYDLLNGTVLSQTGPNGLTTTWTYDGFGRPLTENRPDGTKTLTQYLRCAPGNGVPPRAVHCVYTQSSGSGPAAVYFDLLDRQIRQDATGFDGRMVSTHSVFDVKGQTINTSLPFFSSTAAPTAPTAQYSTNYFDAIGRVIQQNVPGATTETGPRVTTTAYAGLTAKVTNPKSQTFQTTSDLRGRTMSSISFGTDTVTNTHDPYGNLIKVDDGKSHLTTIAYDGRGNKISMTEPNSGTTTYGYNAFGELTTQTDALRRTTTLSYDTLGRMVKRVEPDAPVNGVQAAGIPIETKWVYEYASTGQLNPNGIGKLGYVWRQSDGYLESYRYDRLGRLTETLTQVGSMRFVTATTFDEYSRPDTLSYPTGFAVRNAYNSYGHLASVYDAATPSLVYWTATSVNARGQVVQEQFGNGLVTSRGYDPYTGLLQTIQTGTSGGSTSGVDPASTGAFPAGGVQPLKAGRQNTAAARLTPLTSGAITPTVQNLSFTFDNLNNLTKRQDLNRGITESFTYDSTNQLSGTTCSAAASVTITCDHLGNIANRSDVGTYTYGEHGAGPHAVTSIAGTNGLPSRTLGYNAVGNCVQDGTTALDYNAANQPTTIRASAGTILFSYTASRARLKRSELLSGVLTERVYVGSLYERDDGPNGIVHTHFIPAGGGVVAIRTQTQMVGGTTSQTRYVHKDHLGSIHTLTREDGSIDEVLSFDAWGRRRTLGFDQTSQSLRYSYGTITSQTDRGFTGHEMLDAISLIHMNGRIYDPTIGRFLSVDPVVQEAGNLQNLNRYCYVLNNPLSLTDPSGFFAIGKFFKKYWKPIVAMAVGVITGGAAMAAIYGLDGILAGSTAFLTGSLATGAAVSTGAAVVAGAVAGFGSAFTGTLLAGGSLGDAFRAGAIGSAWGGASAGVFQKIDANLPNWMQTRPLPNETMVTTERLLGQAERIFVRGAAADGIAHLQGSRGHTAFWRSVGFDGASLAQDALNEAEWREEWSLPNHGGHKDWNAIEQANQGFATAQEPAGWKPAYGIAVYNFHAKNFGTPWGEIPGLTANTYDLSKLSAFSEGGSQFTRLAADVPILHQVSIYHDMFITMTEKLVDNQTARSVANWGSMMPYAGFVYGKYSHEQLVRTGQRGR